MAEFEREQEAFGTTLTIMQRSGEGYAGTTVWDGALVLAAYLQSGESFSPGWALGKRVLDLGAGTGICGLVAAAQHGLETVILADVPPMVALLEANVARNAAVLASPVTVVTLPWGRGALARIGGAPVDLVLAAELVYERASFAPLLETLLEVTRSGSCVLLAFEIRNQGEAEFVASCKAHFVLRSVPPAALGAWHSDDIFLIELWRIDPAATDASAAATAAAAAAVAADAPPRSDERDRT